MNERAGEAELLFHAGGVVHRVLLLRIVQREITKQCARARFGFAARLPMHLAHEHENLTASQVVVKNGIVRQIPDPSLHLDAIRAAVEAVDHDAATGRHQDAHHHANRRCLAGAIWPKEAEYFALFDRKIEIAYGRQLAVCLAQTMERDHLHVGPRSSSASSASEAFSWFKSYAASFHGAAAHRLLPMCASYSADLG